MKNQKILFLLFLFCTVALFVFNTEKMGYKINLVAVLGWTRGLLIAGFFGLFISICTNRWRRVRVGLMLVTFGIAFISNLYVLYEYFQYQHSISVQSEYSEYKSCSEIEIRFTTDLKNADLKYFQFGIGTDDDLTRLLDQKYNIQCYAVGCLVDAELACYNNKVGHYLKEKYNDTLLMQ